MSDFRRLKIFHNFYVSTCPNCTMEFVLFAIYPGVLNKDVSDLLFPQENPQHCPYCGSKIRGAEQRLEPTRGDGISTDEEELSG